MKNFIMIFIVFFIFSLKNTLKNLKTTIFSYKNRVFKNFKRSLYVFLQVLQISCLKNLFEINKNIKKTLKINETISYSNQVNVIILTIIVLN